MLMGGTGTHHSSLITRPEGDNLSLFLELNLWYIYRISSQRRAISIKKQIYLLSSILILTFLILAGCGGGSSSVSTPGLEPTNVPSNNQTLDSTGYVYTKSLSGSISSSQAGTQLFIFPNNNVPSGLGLTPAAGVVVRGLQNNTVRTMTDSKGYFSLTSVTGVSGDLTPDILVEAPSGTSAVSYPVLMGTKPASDLIGLTIMPPYNSSGTWSLWPGQVEWFQVIGQDISGNWYAVSDSVNWDVSEGGLGSFVSSSYGIFQASSNPSVSTGYITADLGNGIPVTLQLTVSSTEGFGTIAGHVEDQDGNPVAYGIVEASGCYSTGITDSEGDYSIQVPNGMYTVKARDIYGNSSTEQFVTVQNNTQTANLTFTSSGTVIPAFMNGIVQTEYLSYNAGDNVNAKLLLINLGSDSKVISYSSIKFELIEKATMSGGGTVVDEAITGGGTATIDPYGSVELPSSWAVVTAPADLQGYYYIKGTVYGTEGTVLMSFESPLMLGIGTYYPTPDPNNPNPTPVPGTGSDYQRLGEIKYELNDIYYELYNLANRAYNGENVSSQVQDGSNLKSDIYWVKDDMMPYLEDVNYSDWQTQLDSVIDDLESYVASGGTDYNYLYNASYKIEAIADSVAQAQNNLPASDYRN